VQAMPAASRGALPGRREVAAALEISAPAERIFARICEVESWPVWLPCVRRARLVAHDAPPAQGAEIAVRLDGDAGEELYEVDGFIAHHRLSLVGAYSVRRRIEFRIERKTSSSKVHVRFVYPSYHGIVGGWLDAVRRRRQLADALQRGLVLLKGLVEAEIAD